MDHLPMEATITQKELFHHTFPPQETSKPTTLFFIPFSHLWWDEARQIQIPYEK
jgi:hypothetical protein